MVTAETNALNWNVEQDDDDLTTWSAPSIYHTDGDRFMFRIAEKYVDGTLCQLVTYHEASDAELMINSPRTWEALDKAKADISADHAAMIEAEKK